MEPLLNIDDIQGHILVGFGRAFELLLGVSFAPGAVAGAKPALRSIARDLTPARASAEAKAARRSAALLGEAPEASAALNVALAFSRAGLEKFGADSGAIKDAIFQMGAARSAAALGDQVDASGRPSGWHFGDVPEREPDVLIVIASADEDRVRAAADRYVQLLGDAARVVLRESGRRIARDAEHFGFVDGVSQPGIRGRVSDTELLTPRAYPSANPLSQLWARPGQRLTWPGQFVFGYPGLDPDAMQQPGEIVGGGVSLLANGSLLVVRRLSQDVAAFWNAMTDLAAQLVAATNTAWTPEAAAARCVGRWRDGTPVSLSPTGEDRDISEDLYRRNGFNFVNALPPATLTDSKGDYAFPGATPDPEGRNCPFFGHIRKVNPRDQSHDFGGVGSTLRSQMLRRGVPFGTDWTGIPDGADRGLMFMSYQTSIQHGFYRLMTEWVKEAMRPIAGGIDPVIGPSPAGGRRMQMRWEGQTITVSLDGDFVRATGAGYFFTPGIRTVATLFA